MKGSGARVLLELYAYNSHANALAGLLEGELELMRLDPASYVMARRKGSELTPLVQEVFSGGSELRGAIFTRADSDVRGLEDLRGKSFAFGEVDSAIHHYLPKAELAALGLRVGNFRQVTNLSSSGVITAVRTGQVDAGAADLEDVTRLVEVGAPLRILKEVRSPGYAWVATARLDRRLADAVRDALLGLRDSNVLAALDCRLTGFVPSRPADYDGLEEQIARAERFDAPVPAGASQPR